MTASKRLRSTKERHSVLKNKGGEKLIEAIRQVLLGKTYLSENMSQRITDIFSGRRRADDTTQREVGPSFLSIWMRFFQKSAQ